MERLGMVVKTENNLAKITLQRHSSCAECGGCGAGQEKQKKILIDAVNELNAKVGDLVMVQVPDHNVLFAAFLAYVVPLICLFVGYLLGVKIGFYFEVANSQMFGIAGAFSLLILSFVGLKIFNPRFSSSKRFTPVISKIIEPANKNNS